VLGLFKIGSMGVSVTWPAIGRVLAIRGGEPPAAKGILGHAKPLLLRVGPGSQQSARNCPSGVGPDRLPVKAAEAVTDPKSTFPWTATPTADAPFVVTMVMRGLTELVAMVHLRLFGVRSPSFWVPSCPAATEARIDLSSAISILRRETGWELSGCASAGAQDLDFGATVCD
jgi:hypothetical protein